ncbi:hypothetical protein EAF04_005412 [Stromatinia cepivora]|nr:hypothetical protein EAF04_005412 [Stromatinia cepivora]
MNYIIAKIRGYETLKDNQDDSRKRTRETDLPAQASVTAKIHAYEDEKHFPAAQAFGKSNPSDSDVSPPTSTNQPDLGFHAPPTIEQSLDKKSNELDDREKAVRDATKLRLERAAEARKASEALYRAIDKAAQSAANALRKKMKEERKQRCEESDTLRETSKLPDRHNVEKSLTFTSPEGYKLQNVCWELC